MADRKTLNVRRGEVRAKNYLHRVYWEPYQNLTPPISVYPFKWNKPNLIILYGNHILKKYLKPWIPDRSLKRPWISAKMSEDPWKILEFWKWSLNLGCGSLHAFPKLSPPHSIKSQCFRGVLTFLKSWKDLWIMLELEHGHFVVTLGGSDNVGDDATFYDKNWTAGGIAMISGTLCLS